MFKRLWLIWARTVDHRIGKTDDDKPDIPILTNKDAGYSLLIRTLIVIVNLITCFFIMKDLAPDICRQRIVIEGTLHNPFKPEDMDRYCREMTKVLKMTEATAPFCNYDPDYGWCAYVHWKESGMHIYSWDDRKPCFFSVDIYTCKPFYYQVPVDYTKQFFGDNLIEVVWKE